MKLNNIKIRQSKLSDIESIAEIKVTGFQNAYRGIVDDKYLEDMSISEQINNLNKSYSLENIFVAEKDNEILGFCRICDYDKAVYEDEEIDCEIREIYVKPDLKRMGIGNKLFNYALHHFKQKGKKKLYLGCFRDNYNSRKFYEKMGGVSWNENKILIGGKPYQIVSYVYIL